MGTKKEPSFSRYWHSTTSIITCQELFTHIFLGKIDHLHYLYYYIIIIINKIEIISICLLTVYTFYAKIHRKSDRSENNELIFILCLFKENTKHKFQSRFHFFFNCRGWRYGTFFILIFSATELPPLFFWIITVFYIER